MPHLPWIGITPSMPRRGRCDHAFREKGGYRTVVRVVVEKRPKGRAPILH